MAAPAELRVAVVLQHPGVRPSGPVEQRQPPPDRQRAAQRRGVRRRHQRQPRVRCALDAGGDVQPLGVAGHRHRCGAGGEQRAASGDVARVLDPGGVARIEQQFGGDAQRLLCAGGHHDVGRIGEQPARGGQVGGDLAAQFRQALRRRVAGDVGGQRLQHADGAARPGLLGEQVGRRNAAGQQRAQRRIARGGRSRAPRRGAGRAATADWRRSAAGRPGRAPRRAGRARR